MQNFWTGVAVFVAAAWIPLGSAAPTHGVTAGRHGPMPPVTDERSTGSTPTPTDGFVWPLHPKPEVLRPFEAPPQPWATGHRGVDLAGSVGQPVLAAGGGTVSFSGVIAGRGVLAIQHPDGRRTTYEPVTDRDPTGTVEAAGDRIGALATGDHCGDTPCLHWGLLVGPDDYRDPLSLLEFRSVRLLPLG